VPIPAARATTSRVPGGIEVSIPVRRRVITIVFLVIWLAMWVFAELNAVGSLTFGASIKGPPKEVLGLWLVVWTIGGVFVFAFLLWTLFGRERVRFSSSEVSLRREALGVGLTRRYQPAAVTHLRAVESVSTGPMFGSRDPFGIYSGSIAFDYGAKTIRFGAGIDSAEARKLVADILAAMPSLAPR
jgi:hypothetical protein